MKHRYLSILLALIIIFTMNPAAVYAAAESAAADPAAAVLDELESVETETFGLPADVGVGEELNDVPETDNVYSADSPESFAGIVKECLLRRETPFAVTIDYEVPLEGSEDLQALYDEKFDLVNEETAKAVHDLAIAHTGVPKEGDYINGQIAWKRFNKSEPVIENNILSIHFIYTYAVDYYASAEEEAKVDEEIERILRDGTLDLEGLTDYAKVKAIHDFICGTITYDDVHVGDTSYAHQYTPYAALFDHTAVCQGYALLFYRLCLEAGIDARFVFLDFLLNIGIQLLLLILGEVVGFPGILIHIDIVAVRAFRHFLRRSLLHHLLDEQILLLFLLGKGENGQEQAKGQEQGKQLFHAGTS